MSSVTEVVMELAAPSNLAPMLGTRFAAASRWEMKQMISASTEEPRNPLTVIATTCRSPLGPSRLILVCGFPIRSHNSVGRKAIPHLTLRG
jgi:hypothetical protein